MKKLLLIGANCQGKPLGGMLLRDEAFGSDFEIVTRENFSEFKEQDNELDTLFRQIDVYIYQPISPGFYYNFGFLEKNLLRKECKTISFPVLYFTGYWPDADKADGSSLNNDVFPYQHNMLEQIMGEMGAENMDSIISKARNLNLFTGQDVSDNLLKTLAELMVREVGIDIKACEFINANFSKHRLFHTPNHPSNRLLAFVADRILGALGYHNPEGLIPIADEYLGTYQFLIYPAVMKHLALQFVTASSQINLCAPSHYKDRYPDIPKDVNVDEYIKWFIRIFEKEINNR